MDQHPGLPCRPLGQDGTWPLVDQARAWHHQRTDAQQGAIPGTIYRVSRAGSKEKEDPTPSKDLLGLWFFFFLPSVIPTPP